MTADEWEAACSIGRKRQWLREQRGRSPAEYSDRGGTHLDRNAIGAVAEYVLAKHYGAETLRDWCENKSFSLEHHLIPCDVGKNLHVRATKLPHGRLIAHPYDPDGGVFVLARVDSTNRAVTFVGWAYGHAVKQRPYWTDTGPGFKFRPAFVFPSELLYPFGTVPEEAIR